MIVVDRDRCGYCGGCVSVCPVDALTLAETRLVVGESCIDCGDCIVTCPVGALRLEDAVLAWPGEALRRSYDVVVVGAGPGGQRRRKRLPKRDLMYWCWKSARRSALRSVVRKGLDTSN